MCAQVANSNKEEPSVPENETFKAGDKVEFLSVDVLPDKVIWVECKVARKLEKEVAGRVLVCYVVEFFTGDLSTVESWRVRKICTTRAKLADTKFTRNPGVKLEVQRKADPDTNWNKLCWKPCKLVQPFDPTKDISVTVEYIKSPQHGDAVLEEVLVLSKENIRFAPIGASEIWPLPQIVVSDQEHIVPRTLTEISAKFTQLLEKIDKLDLQGLEPIRDELLDKVDTLNQAHYYEESMQVIETLRLIEDVMAQIAFQKQDAETEAAAYESPAPSSPMSSTNGDALS